MFGKPADETLRALRRLQDKLGAHQDAYMSRNRLAALAADPANGLPPATLFLMGRLAEHHASTTAEARKTLTGSWRKVRGKRWRALRTKLGELSDTAREANNSAPAQPTRAHDAIAAASLEHVPEPEPRPIKH
jgi:hypothetical protein